MNTEKAIKWFVDEIKSLKIAPSINGCEMTNEWREQIEIFEMALQALEVKDPKTRYDQIRTMSVEEMAKLFNDDGIMTDKICHEMSECSYMDEDGDISDDCNCTGYIKEWLLQEVSEND